ncbi:hypothetical protein IHV25_03660 [Phaeovibrio sulfidiphilus]|uniref:Uncharacterized protein n=1 Tax=Phaeovibrio sulfidiphilus TaxID=1220600 RepID=A0A8J6YUN4_9PROT|nr:hypothetical protein [Phaeovibrio sulfidiphilus]MBE1236749.1 hypothetical protein [Phaeovibrio sulfidiphilus]
MRQFIVGLCLGAALACSLLAPLALAIGPDDPLTAATVKKMCRSHPPSRVVARLLETPEKTWQPLLEQVAEGKPEWLEICTCLSAGGALSRSARASEELEIALASALPRNPCAVLMLERRGVSLARVCSVPFLVSDRATLEAYHARVQEALASVEAPGLAVERDVCRMRLEAAWARLTAPSEGAPAPGFFPDDTMPEAFVPAGPEGGGPEGRPPATGGQAGGGGQADAPGGAVSGALASDPLAPDAAILDVVAPDAAVLDVVAPDLRGSGDGGPGRDGSGGTDAGGREGRGPGASGGAGVSRNADPSDAWWGRDAMAADGDTASGPVPDEPCAPASGAGGDGQAAPDIAPAAPGGDGRGL